MVADEEEVLYLSNIYKDLLATFANFISKWFRKYRQKLLDKSKQLLYSSTVASQLIVTLFFCSLQVRTNKPSQPTQYKSMDSAALAETKISSNSSKSKTIDCE